MSQKFKKKKTFENYFKENKKTKKIKTVLVLFLFSIFFLSFSFPEASCNLLFCHCLGINKISKERSLRVPSNCRPSVLTTVRDFKNTLRRFCVRIHVISLLLGKEVASKTFSIYPPQFCGLWRSDTFLCPLTGFKAHDPSQDAVISYLTPCRSVLLPESWKSLPLVTGLLQCTAFAREKSKWKEKYKQVKHN